MGGQIVLRYAADDSYGADRVVTTGSGPRFCHNRRPAVGAARRRHSRAHRRRSLRPHRDHRRPLRQQPLPRRPRRHSAMVHPDRLARPSLCRRHQLRSRRRPGSPRGPFEDHRPRALLSGRRDLVWAAQWSHWAHEHTPGSTLTFFENSGHVAFIENRVEWNGALVDVTEGRTPAESLGVDTVPALVIGLSALQCRSRRIAPMVIRTASARLGDGVSAVVANAS